MSAETIAGLHDAIRAHVADALGDDRVLTDWFIGFGTMFPAPDHSEGIGYGHSYITSPTSPQGVLGIGQLALANLEGDLFGDEED